MQNKKKSTYIGTVTKPNFKYLRLISCRLRGSQKVDDLYLSFFRYTVDLKFHLKWALKPHNFHLQIVNIRVSDERRSRLLLFSSEHQSPSTFYVSQAVCIQRAISEINHKEKSRRKEIIYCILASFSHGPVVGRHRDTFGSTAAVTSGEKRGKNNKVRHMLESCEVRMKAENIAADEHSSQLVHLLIALFFQF